MSTSQHTLTKCYTAERHKQIWFHWKQITMH